MKPCVKPSKLICNCHQPQKPLPHCGFALVVTLTLMVLLSILAIGMLSLSSVALRSAGVSDSAAVARSNARLALMIAIGQLQRTAGKDQSVTARADILGLGGANPYLTGVWNSWEMKATSPPQPADFQRPAEDGKFLNWLVSNGNQAAVKDPAFAAAEPSNPVTLWGTGSFGTSAASNLSVKAGKTLVNNSKGNFAWAVLDEGVKARINTPYDPVGGTTGGKIAELGSGVRPGVEFINGTDVLKRDFFKKGSTQYAAVSKGISAPTFALAGESLAAGTAQKLMPLLHDLTTDSVGLFTDTARGGLRQDFNLMANAAALPSQYDSKGIYQSRLAMANADAPSDPRWSAFHEFSRLYRDRVTMAGGSPLLHVSAPSGWAASTTTTDANPETTINTVMPPGLVMMPNIAKVQMIFSLIGRDIYNYPAFPAGQTPPPVPDSAANMHAPQDGHFRGTKYKYDLHLLYTPVVTLHNPYNVALSFTDLRVDFRNVPFAMQVFRNGQAQSTGLVPLDSMYGDNDQGQASKTFGMKLLTKVNERPGSPNFVLLPGEVKLFSPFIDPDRTYRTDLGSRQFWDIYVSTGLTKDILAIPGWRGDGIGYDCDWLAGSQRIDGTASNGRWASCYGLAWDDEIHVEFAPLSTAASKNKFFITMTAQPSGGNPAGSSAIEMDYGTPDGLRKALLGAGNTLRFPATGTVKGHELVDHSTRKIKEITAVKPFAMISAQASTTFGGNDPSGKDGRLATKPWAFAHGTTGAVKQKIGEGSAVGYSHTIDIQRLELGRGTTEVIPIDPMDRGVFITGHSTFNGKKFGAQYEIPLAPLQTLASLNGANPGGSSAFLPRFANPIGNSWAHPLIAPEKITQPGADGIPYLDHSFLLNTALYDGFYFSGLSDRIGPVGSSKTAAMLATEFAAGNPLGDPRLTLHTPDGKPPTGLAAVVADPTAGFQKIAGWQLMKGAFNINSTSIPAWTAMLASVHDGNAVMNLVNRTNGTSSIQALSPAGTGAARISRFRLPMSESPVMSPDPQSAYWLGPREYTNLELQLLAAKIVEQVRARGPFLSLAEFVNRQTGTGEKAQRGALQQAIDDSGLNLATATTANAGYAIDDNKVKDYGYANAAAGTGPSYQGAPGFLTQADLLTVLGDAATARSDTFVIRGYGDAVDASGRILAKAFCEATVQRMPEWVDSSDAVETTPSALTSQVNKDFGRRFRIVSFRWLHPGEI